MRGVNKVILIGNAGNDPEVKVLADGSLVAKISMATTETYRLKSGETGSKTEWHQIVAWRSVAELIQKFVRKGSHLYIEGKIRYRNYEDKDGQQRYVTEIHAEQILLLDKKATRSE